MLLCLLVVLAGLSPAGVRAGTEAELGPALQSALQASGLRRGISGILVESLRDGRTLYAANADTALVPASNLIIVTAALGMARLGPEHRFRTLLARGGSVRRGTLRGDLFLKGFGDPSLTAAHLAGMAREARAAGIRRIRGDLVVDETFFAGPRLRRGWSWDYLQDYYAMEVSALSVDGNVVRLSVTPGARPGRPARVAWTPAVRGFFTVRNEATTGPAGTPPALTIERLPGRNEITVRGRIAAGAPPAALDEVTVMNPALYAGHVLAQSLAEAGISLSGKVRPGTLPATGAATVAERRSETLASLLPAFLKPSDNHYGEQILGAVLATEAARRAPAANPGVGPATTPAPVTPGGNAGGNPVALPAGSTPTGGAGTTGAAASSGATPASQSAEVTVESLFADYLKEIGGEADEIRAVDGSGLSRLDLVTPRALVRVLRHVRGQPYAEAFVAALPVAGKDGTLARRMRATRAEGNVRAKTGTVNAVSCLSGYVTTAGGEPLVFSLMMNHFLGPTPAAREAQDRICALLADH